MRVRILLGGFTRIEGWGCVEDDGEAALLAVPCSEGGGLAAIGAGCDVVLGAAARAEAAGGGGVVGLAAGAAREIAVGGGLAASGAAHLGTADGLLGFLLLEELGLAQAHEALR